MQSALNHYIKFVTFTEFNLWDVKRYYNASNLKFDNVVTLADILIPYRKPVSKDEMIKNKWQIISKISYEILDDKKIYRIPVSEDANIVSEPEFFYGK